MSLIFRVCTFVFVLFIGLSVAQAASFKRLEKKGFSVGKMTRAKSGKSGWYLTKGDERYFCLSRISLVYIGKSKMASFTSSGKTVFLDRKAYHSYSGIKDPSRKIPQLADVKAGRVDARHVGSCKK